MHRPTPAPSTAADTTDASPIPDDPYLWLEEVQGDRALAWVHAQNALTAQALAGDARFASLEAAILGALQASDRIPSIARHGDHVYNVWQDVAHVRGVWRRTTLADFRHDQPAWETVLDLDALGASEGESWVWGGAVFLPPDDRLCLVSLSRGGADAHVVREFDTQRKCFVAGGFALPEAKSEVRWRDIDRLYVGTDTGPGTMTDAGYPRTLRLWQRGTPLAAAPVVFEGAASDVAVSVDVDTTPGHQRILYTRATDFFHSLSFLQRGDALASDDLPIDIPADAGIDFLRDTLLLQLRSDLDVADQHFPAGSLLHADAAAYLRGERRLAALFTPTATRSLDSYVCTRHHVVLTVLDDVAHTVEVWRKEGGAFVRTPFDLPGSGGPGTVAVAALDDPHRPDDPLADTLLLKTTDFLHPDTLYLVDVAGNASERLKSRSALFDATGMRAEQQFATSADGTQVPYFVIWPADVEPGVVHPTLLYGYGGFEVSLTPWYSGSHGRAWYERGGVFVVANIRGGGEYGPRWHQAALKACRQRSYDDFIAVAQDLIARRITTPAQLGIMGGSNGGLLVGAAFTQRPDLFNAVVCQVPLLDMRRFHLLLAGASWTGEYGDPDVPADWAAIARYSPYHNLKSDARYPKVLFTTSTRDDRVHPGHARKMAARMLAQGHAVLYHENTEGGHGGAADQAQRARLLALEFNYLWQQLGR